MHHSIQQSQNYRKRLEQKTEKKALRKSCFIDYTIPEIPGWRKTSAKTTQAFDYVARMNGIETAMVKRRGCWSLMNFSFPASRYCCVCFFFSDVRRISWWKTGKCEMVETTVRVFFLGILISSRKERNPCRLVRLTSDLETMHIFYLLCWLRRNSSGGCQRACII